MDTNTGVAKPLGLALISLGVPAKDGARTFYTRVFSPVVGDDEQNVNLDTHGTGRFGLDAMDVLASDTGSQPTTSGFRGYVLTYILSQPTEVEMVMKAAIEAGAEVIKPTKKALFGSFAGVFRAPDGAIWKLASASNKDTGAAAEPPRPTETTVILGVTKPKASKAFYQSLGMTVDRDYGNKYIDFQPSAGASRLCLMERPVLAKDAGVDKGGDGFSAMVLNHRADSREDVDHLLTAATAAGGRLAVPATEIEGVYAGTFADPDGFLWKVTH